MQTIGKITSVICRNETKISKNNTEYIISKYHIEEISPKEGNQLEFVSFFGEVDEFNVGDVIEFDLKSKINGEYVNHNGNNPVKQDHYVSDHEMLEVIYKWVMKQ